MLSDVLAALQEVKSQLQDQLALQPGYQALLILDRATSQLGAVLDCKSEAFSFSKYAPNIPSETIDAADPIAASEVSDEPSALTASFISGERNGDEVGSEDDDPEEGHIRAVLPLYGPSDAALVHLQRRSPSRKAVSIPDSAIVSDAASVKDSAAVPPFGFPPIEPEFDPPERRSAPAGIATSVMAVAARPKWEISGMAALYQSAGEAADAPGSEPRSAGPAVAIAEPTAGALTKLDTRDRTADAPARGEPHGGLTAALYESTGDAPDLEATEERPDVTTSPGEPEDPAADVFVQTLADAAKKVSVPIATAPSPAEKPVAPRNYLPIIAAQRLIQSRRF
jgi:hypothetical protein